MSETSTIAVQLRLARDIRGLSRREVCKAAGIHNTQISRYESGLVQPDLWTLVRIADALGVTTDFLVGRSPDIEPSSACADDLTSRFSQLAAHDQVAVSELIDILIRRRFEP